MPLFTEQVRELVKKAGIVVPAQKAAEAPGKPAQNGPEDKPKQAEGAPDGGDGCVQKKAFADMTDEEKTAALKQAARDDLNGRIAALAYIDEMHKLAASPLAKILPFLKNVATRGDESAVGLGQLIGSKARGTFPFAPDMTPAVARTYGYGALGAGAGGAAGVASALKGQKKASAGDFESPSHYGAYLGVTAFQKDKG